MFVLRVIACAFAFVCCSIAVHVTLVCRLHACFAFVYFVCLYLYATSRVRYYMHLLLIVARLCLILHVCVNCTRGLLSCFRSSCL